MSFQPELRPVYEDHITKVATQLRLSVKRADDFFTAHAVMQDIWAAKFFWPIAPAVTQTCSMRSALHTSLVNRLSS
jgi:hypothetical protein